jgi:hypothetical protein
LGTVFEVSPPATSGGAWTEAVLHSFKGGTSDGANPYYGSLIADSSGNLYGTTQGGGASGTRCGGPGCGTVFKLAGTGFVMPIPFSAFSAELEIGLNTDTFVLRSSFTLGSTSKGINPPAEPVILQVGTFTTTIPPGSFEGSGFGPFYFTGVINGVDLEVAIVPTGAKRYDFTVAAASANLAGTANPVTVTLGTGADTGKTSVKAGIFN